MNSNLFTTYASAVAVTPSDATILQAKALIVGGAGALVVEPATGGNTLTITAIAGQFLPINIRRVLATGTVATGIVALN